MTFTQPLWLLLLLPLAALVWLWPLPTRALQALRMVALALIVLAMAGLSVLLPRREGTVVVVADRSESMPESAGEAQLEAVRLLERTRRGDSRLAVVSFAERAGVESPSGAIEGFSQEYTGGASDLTGALEAALSLIPPQADGRLLVISDGRWTGRDPQPMAHQASARGIPIDYRLLRRSSAADLALAGVEAPAEVSPGEAFTITAWIESPVEQEVGYELRGGGQVLASGRRTLRAGRNRLVFRDRALSAGTTGYTLRIQGEGPDPVPRNNLGRFLITTRGERPLLALSRSGESGLSRLLRRGGLNVRSATPESSSFDLGALSGHSALILEDLPAQRLGRSAMRNIAAWVREAGAGLMITGGLNSFAPGGYYESPLDPILPVSMELRQEHRKFRLAIALALDRSGSMAAPAGAGMSKMDLANQAALEVLDLLGGRDEIAVLAVDSAAHPVVPMTSVAEARGRRAEIATIQSGGGGIYVYEALAAAAGELLRAQAGTRHIVLFADAADSEHPHKYISLIQECREAGITVSVIGLGSESDRDAPLLEDIARRGMGQLYFTRDPQDLPRLFAQDTFMVARSTFIAEPAPVRFTAGLYTLLGRALPQPPAAGGYNLAYLRPEADQAAVTADEYQAPFVASWQAGAGRALAYTGQADGRFAGDLGAWANSGEMLAGLARWTAGERRSLPDHMLLRQEVREGVLRVELLLDPEREGGDPRRKPRLTVLRETPGRAPRSQQAELRWTSADSLGLEVPLRDAETVLAGVEIEGRGRLLLPAVRTLYPPEFAPASRDRGPAALRGLASAANGLQRLDLPSIWDSLPRRPHRAGLAHWLLAAAAAALLLEVLERRSGALSRLAARRTAYAARMKQKWVGTRLNRRGRPKPGKRGGPPPEKPSPEKQEVSERPRQTPAAPEGLSDALSRARDRAKGRTKRSAGR